MNALAQLVAAFREAIGPLLVAANDPAEWAVLQKALGISGVPAPSFDTSGIESFLQNPDPQLADFLALAADIAALEQDVRGLFNALPSQEASDALETAASALVITYLQSTQPFVYLLCRMLAIIDMHPTRRGVEEIHIDRLGRLITDIHGYLRSIYPLQTEADAKATSDKIFPPVAAAAMALNHRMSRRGGLPLQVLYGWDAPPAPGASIAEAIAQRTLSFVLGWRNENDVETSVLFSSVLIPAVHGGPGLALRFEGADMQAPLGGDWVLDAALDSSLALVWKFGDDITVSGAAGATVSLGVSRPPDPARKPTVLPILGNTRVELGDVDLRLTAGANELDAKVTLHNAALVIGKDSADSFSGSRMPGTGVRGDFDLVIGVSSVRGVYLGGTAGISATIPLNKDVGPLHLDTLRIEVRPDSATSAIRVSAGLTLSLEIGPVLAVVDGIGVRLDVSFPQTGANLGVVDVRPKFQWPRGIGVTIDAGAVSGGGYIYFDPDNGRYAGVLQLELKTFSIKAIGLLDTKLPGGKKGFSFLIIISAEFSPIALAMGFTLNGVGGLAGLHRTIVVEALQAGVRNHAVDDILFPDDPVKNAPRIISDLQKFFPPMQGRYVFGPMALIGWGTPTLITIELGIILELPAPLRILLLGQLHCTLPETKPALIELHVDILGVLDFGAKLFALDGVIHDSKIGAFAISGDFAVRLRWGASSSFALSVGGFHPRFALPDQFPSLRRLTLALSEGDNPRLTMQCYFAVTSNSLQFGARADLYAAAGKFNVSGWIDFNVLIVFRPFSLRADLSAGFALRRGSRYLAGIHIEATLTGPGPWHVWGSASITILCWDVSVDFDLTIGSATPQPLPPTSIWPSLKPAIEDGGSWSATLPPAVARVVSLTAPSNGDVPLLDPMGLITMTQRTAPLNHVNSRFADGAPAAPRRFDLFEVIVFRAGSGEPLFGLPAPPLVHELFPPAQFEQMSDDAKLSRASFEKMVAGLVFPDMVAFSQPVGTPLAYRTVVLDSPVESHNGALYHLSGGVLEAVARAGAAASGGMHRSGSDRYVTPAPPKVVLLDETYVIASAANLTRRSDLAAAGTKADVLESLAQHLAAHPEDRGRLVVIPEEEAA